MAIGRGYGGTVDFTMIVLGIDISGYPLIPIPSDTCAFKASGQPKYLFAAIKQHLPVCRSFWMYLLLLDVGLHATSCNTMLEIKLKSIECHRLSL